MFNLGLTEKAIAAAACVGIVVAIGYGLRVSGYRDGKAACEAANAAKVLQATRDSAAVEQASDRRTLPLEPVHVTQQTDLERRYADLTARFEWLRAESRRRPAPDTAGAASVGHADPDRSGLPGGDGGVDAILAEADRLAGRTLEAGRDAERLRLGLGTLQQYGGEVNVFRADVRRLNERSQKGR